MRVSRIQMSFVLITAGLLVACAAWIGGSLYFLPSVEPLKNPRASFAITVKDWNRKDHSYVLGPSNRYWTPISGVPASLRKAVIAAEDANFYSHEGVDYEAIKEALKADLQKGKFVRGGSTITQQVAKNIYLSREKTISRKVKEFVLARRLDKALTKSRILELYLNVVELGPMIYGVGHASQYYFGKHPSALTVRESSFLASMLPGPKVYDPYRKLDRVVRRSDRILDRMFAAKMITEEEYKTAFAETPNIAGLERKVEKTLAEPPPEEKIPVEMPENGPRLLDAPAAKDKGAAPDESGEFPGQPQEQEDEAPESAGPGAQEPAGR